MPIITPSFTGAKTARYIQPEKVAEHLNKKFLFYKLWGFKPEDLHQSLSLKEEINQTLKKMHDWGKTHLFPAYTYALYPCHKNRDTLNVFPVVSTGCASCGHCKMDFKNSSLMKTFFFEREQNPPNRSLLDYFSEKEDTVAFQLVTMGQEAVDFGQKLKNQDRYQDFFYWYGYCSAMTEALASLVHAFIRKDLGIARDNESIDDCLNMNFQGKRYSFGYNWCKDMDEQRKVLDLLDNNQIKVRMNESDELEPEFSTCAVVTWHPQSIYW